MYLCHRFDLANKMNNWADTFIDQSRTHSTGNRQEMHASVKEDLTSVPRGLAINLKSETTQPAALHRHIVLQVRRLKVYFFWLVGNIFQI